MGIRSRQWVAIKARANSQKPKNRLVRIRPGWYQISVPAASLPYPSLAKQGRACAQSLGVLSFNLRQHLFNQWLNTIDVFGKLWYTIVKINVLIGFTQQMVVGTHATVGMGLAPDLCVSRGRRRFV